MHSLTTDKPIAEPKTSHPAWLLVLMTVQGAQGALRMRLWRTLKGLGTAVLRDGAYLLPNRPALLASVQALEREVTAADGSVQLLELDARDATQQREFEALFDRTTEYEKMLHAVRETRRKLAKMEAAAITTAVARLRRDFENLAVTDFFPGRAAAQAAVALEDLLAEASAVLSPDEPHAVEGRIAILDPASYLGRTWATRKHPWADRLASAWLIRRFIDPQARILWLNTPADCPSDALGFDFDGATFTHIGNRVTFEVLAASFALDRDTGVQRIGDVIHFLDVGGAPIQEAAGIEAILRGACEVYGDDDQLLNEVEKIFNYLYGAFTTQH